MHPEGWLQNHLFCPLSALMRSCRCRLLVSLLWLLPVCCFSLTWIRLLTGVPVVYSLAAWGLQPNWSRCSAATSQFFWIIFSSEPLPLKDLGWGHYRVSVRVATLLKFVTLWPLDFPLKTLDQCTRPMLITLAWPSLVAVRYVIPCGHRSARHRSACIHKILLKRSPILELQTMAAIV